MRIRTPGATAPHLAALPHLALALADTEIPARDPRAALPTVEAPREAIEDLVDDGRIQEARDFGSEIVLRTTDPPLAATAEGLKSAAAFLEAGDVGAALLVPEAALTQGVVTETILPLPDLRAELPRLAAGARLVPEATEDERAEAARPVADARREVELARAHGYGTRRDHRARPADIDRLEDAAIETPVERAFEGVRARLGGLFE